jgi:hypothetical protein
VRKAFLLAYSNSLGTRDQVKQYLNSMPEVYHWRYDLPNAFYLISNSTSKDLGIALHRLAGNQGRFIIVEIQSSYGWLPKQTWYLIKNKEHPPKLPDAG